jgi:hypothetical protein
VTDDLQRCREVLFADLDPQRVAQAHAQFVLQSVASFVAPSGAPAPSHPSAYVLCTEDQTIPIAAQEAMSAAADHTVRIHSAHCPEVTTPEELADVLARVVATQQRRRTRELKSKETL